MEIEQLKSTVAKLGSYKDQIQSLDKNTHLKQGHSLYEWVDLVHGAIFNHNYEKWPKLYLAHTKALSRLHDLSENDAKKFNANFATQQAKLLLILNAFEKALNKEIAILEQA